jgi:DNA polymerase-3 subunit gamma/tau
MPASFPAMIEAIAKAGRAHIAQQLHDFVGLVRFAPPELVVRPSKPLPGEFLRDLGAALKAVTGATWQVSASDAEAEPSLLDQEKEGAEKLRQQVLDTPIVQAALEAFPEAELAGYRIDSHQRSA